MVELGSICINFTVFEFWHYLLRLEYKNLQSLEYLKELFLFLSLKDLFDKFLYSLRFLLHILTPTREMPFFAFLNFKYLTHKSCDVYESNKRFLRLSLEKH